MRIKQLWDVVPLPYKLRLAVRSRLDNPMSFWHNTFLSTLL